jgi:hypothetical protein
MTHAELSVAVHELGIRYGSHDTHTSECLTVGRKGAEAPYYYAQVWFSRAQEDCVGAMGTAEGALRQLREKLFERGRIDLAKPMHPMARHAAMLMAAEVES